MSLLQATILCIYTCVHCPLTSAVCYLRGQTIKLWRLCVNFSPPQKRKGWVPKQKRGGGCPWVRFGKDIHGALGRQERGRELITLLNS